MDRKILLTSLIKTGEITLYIGRQVNVSGTVDRIASRVNKNGKRRFTICLRNVALEGFIVDHLWIDQTSRFPAGIEIGQWISFTGIFKTYVNSIGQQNISVKKLRNFKIISP